MKIGISAFAWTGSFTASHLGLLGKGREYGFEAFEVPMFDPSELPLELIRKAFAAEDLAASVCAIPPPGINPISPDAAIRKRSEVHLADCLHAAAEIGAHLLGGPVLAPIGYLPGHRPHADEWKWAADLCHSVEPLLAAYDITLSLEPVNRSETFFLRSAEDAARLCAEVGNPRIGVTLDTFHANIEEANIPAAIGRLGPALKHMHLSENDRGTLGRGHIDFRAILSALHSVSYDRTLMIEGFGFTDVDRTAPGFLWADPSTGPETLARQSLAYLQDLVNQDIASL